MSIYVDSMVLPSVEALTTAFGGFRGCNKRLNGAYLAFCTICAVIVFWDYTITFLRLQCYRGACRARVWKCCNVGTGYKGPNRVACVALRRLRCLLIQPRPAMFLRSSPRLFFAFSTTRLVTRCLYRATLPPIGHRVSQTRSFTTPAPQVAQRFGVAFSSVTLS